MKKIIPLFIITLISITINAQDVIIKNDKKEIESKIIEITETVIKYKKWDFKDGPTYNINKSEVFMIIYSNGKKEYFEARQQSVPQNSHNTPTTSSTNRIYEATTSSINSTINNDNNTSSSNNDENNDDDYGVYHPDISRISIGFSSSTNAEISTIGLTYHGVFTLGQDSGAGAFELELGSTITYGSGEVGGLTIEESLYYINLGVGYGIYVGEDLKISGGVGYFYGFGTLSIENNEIDINGGDIYFHSAIDYFFTDGFGINARYDGILGPQFGVSFTF